jgi:murein DD-endopeptidase MepM/ murein hydrolase activator NlpD
MEGRRQFVQRLGRPRNLAAYALALVATVAAHTAEGQIDPHMFARAYVPGEVVRFEVTTDPAVVVLSGTFHGSSLTFFQAARETGDPVWIAWGVIPLDAVPGTSSYRLTAKTASGSSLAIDGALAISAKSFPEQRLTVESKFVNPPGSAAKRIEREKKRLGAIYARRTPLPPPASPFVSPVPGEPTSEFGTRRIFNGEPRAPHPGIDLRAASGTPVAVSGPGRVALATILYFSGGTVIVDHGGGLFTVYAHLSKIETKEGVSVRAGDVVGMSGATGRVTGPHLHWGARVGEAIFDPRALLDSRLFGPAEAPAPGAPHTP